MDPYFRFLLHNNVFFEFNFWFILNLVGILRRLFPSVNPKYLIWGYVLICVYCLPLIIGIISALSIITCLLIDKTGFYLWFYVFPPIIIIGTLSILYNILYRFMYPPKKPLLYPRAPMYYPRAPMR